MGYPRRAGLHRNAIDVDLTGGRGITRLHLWSLASEYFQERFDIPEEVVWAT